MTDYERSDVFWVLLFLNNGIQDTGKLEALKFGYKLVGFKLDNILICLWSDEGKILLENWGR